MTFAIILAVITVLAVVWAAVEIRREGHQVRNDALRARRGRELHRLDETDRYHDRIGWRAPEDTTTTRRQL